LYENGFYDDAASRAYYAMYHATKAALLLKEIDTKSHKGFSVEDYIKKKRDSEGPRLCNLRLNTIFIFLPAFSFLHRDECIYKFIDLL